ncbi:hypothetical protein [Synechococcus sp. MIT S1220]|uniref:hypothetical protein n=1 Tax=Synechococcus sp. MIT S1220 TaxID=3082549 RepID=UPI0039B086EE
MTTHHPAVAVGAVEWRNRHPVAGAAVEADCRCPSEEKVGVAVVVEAVLYQMRYRIQTMAGPSSNLLELNSM